MNRLTRVFPLAVAISLAIGLSGCADWQNDQDGPRPTLMPPPLTQVQQGRPFRVIDDIGGGYKCMYFEAPSAEEEASYKRFSGPTFAYESCPPVIDQGTGGDQLGGPDVKVLAGCRSPEKKATIWYYRDPRVLEPSFNLQDIKARCSDAGMLFVEYPMPAAASPGPGGVDDTPNGFGEIPTHAAVDARLRKLDSLDSNSTDDLLFVRQELQTFSCRFSDTALSDCQLPSDFVDLDYFWELVRQLEIFMYNHPDYKYRNMEAVAATTRTLAYRIETLPVYAQALAQVRAQESAVLRKIGWKISHVVTVGLSKRMSALSNLRSLWLDEGLVAKARALAVDEIFVYGIDTFMLIAPRTYYIGYEVTADQILARIPAG